VKPFFTRSCIIGEINNDCGSGGTEYKGEERS